MDEQINLTVNNSALINGFREASGEITRIAQDEIAPAAGLIEDAFSSAANSIQVELGRAARTGELSLRSLINTIARDLGRGAIDGLVRRPIQSLLTSFLSAPFGGARANGGFVAPGSSFLVGERGPELFTPNGSGRITSNGAGGGASGMTVNINLPGVRDVDGFRRSQTQIAASLSRVLSNGQRNL